MLTTLASEIMTSPVVTIAADRPVSEAAARMLEKNIGSLVIVDDDGLITGLLSESKYLPGRVGAAVSPPVGAAYPGQ